MLIFPRSLNNTPRSIYFRQFYTLLGVRELRKEVEGNGTSRWFRVAKTSTQSTIGGIVGYTSYENVAPFIFAFTMMKYDTLHYVKFESICGNSTLKQYFRYKNTTEGFCLWINTWGAETKNFIIPTVKGTYSNFDVIQEDPPADALEPEFD